MENRAELVFDPLENAKELEESGDGASFTSAFDHINIERPNHLKGMSVGTYLKKANWTSSGKNSYGNKVESAWKNGKHYAYCTGHGRRRIPLEVSQIKSAKNILKINDTSCIAFLHFLAEIHSPLPRY